MKHFTYMTVVYMENLFMNVALKEIRNSSKNRLVFVVYNFKCLVHMIHGSGTSCLYCIHTGLQSADVPSTWFSPASS